jgi:hypothetical protein
MTDEIQVSVERSNSGSDGKPVYIHSLERPEPPRRVRVSGRRRNLRRPLHRTSSGAS